MSRGRQVRESELRVTVQRVHPLPDLVLLHQRLDAAVLSAELGAAPLEFKGSGGQVYRIEIVPAPRRAPRPSKIALLISRARAAVPW